MPPLVLLALLLAAAFALYYPGADGPYLLDDYRTLVRNPALDPGFMERHGLGPSLYSFGEGIRGRPLAMFSFAANYAAAGTQAAFSVKLINIVLHLMVGMGLFALTRRVYPSLAAGPTGDRPSPAETTLVAAVAAGIWLLHPIQVSTVLYAVQRMTILSALFTVSGLLLYWEGRRQMLFGRREGAIWVVGGIGIGGGLALLSKENGALLAVYALVLEATVLRFRAHPTYPPRLARLTLSVPVALSVLILGYLLTLGITDPATGSGTGIKHGFTVTERLLTESRILFFYLRDIFLPDVSRMGLFWETPVLSRDPWTPPSTVLALLALGIAAGLAIWGAARGRFLVAAFMVLWFLTSHIIESTVVRLELIFEHRNYLALYGPALFAGFAFARLRPRSAVWRGGAGVALLMVLATLLAERVGYWSDADRFYRKQTRDHPGAPRLWRAYARHLERTGREDEAITIYSAGQEAIPGEPGYPLGRWYLLAKGGRPVPPAVVEEARTRLDERGVSQAAAWQLYRLVCDTPASDPALQAVLETATGSERSNPAMHALSIGLLARFHERSGHPADTYWQQLEPDVRRRIAAELADCNGATDGRAVPIPPAAASPLLPGARPAACCVGPLRRTSDGVRWPGRNS